MTWKLVPSDALGAICCCGRSDVPSHHQWCASVPQAELQYNMALCCYKLKQYSQALKHLAEIVERGVWEHPELGVGR
jgi:hypothetical protein